MIEKETYPERDEISTDYVKHFVNPDNTNKFHRHPCCELMIINRGEATVLADERTSNFGEHYISFYPPNQLHKQSTSAKEIYERYRIRFFPEKIYNAFSNADLNSFLRKFTIKKIAPADFEAIISLAKLLHRETAKSDKKLSYPLLESLLHSLLLLCIYAKEADVQKSDNYIAKVTDYIYENCNKKLTVSSIADQFFVSPGKLNYDFRSYCNMTVLEYLTLTRVEKAKTLLLLGYSVAATAAATGFTTTSYFIKVFSFYVGTTPLKFQINSAR